MTFEIFAAESAIIGLCQLFVALVLLIYVCRTERSRHLFGVCAVVMLSVVAVRNAFGVARPFLPDPNYFNVGNVIGGICAVICILFVIVCVWYVRDLHHRGADMRSDFFSDPRMSQELVHQQREFQALANTSPNILFIADTSGQIQWINKRFYELTGVQFTGDYAADLHAAVPDAKLHEQMNQGLRHAMFAGEEYAAEVQLCMKDGSFNWFLVRCAPMRNAKGQIAHWYVAMTDINEQKQRLSESQRTLDAFAKFYLPRSVPQVRNLQFDSVYQPASEIGKVGGDWYDYFVLPDGRVAVSVGDVSGNGVEAAVWMGRIKASMSIEARDVNPEPENVLQKANRVLTLFGKENPMVTAVYGIIDYKKMTFTYATAGHYPPMLVTKDGRASVLPHDGIPLGVENDLGDVVLFTVPIEPESLLVFYTDGLVEATHNIFEGEGRLLNAAREATKRGVAKPAKFIVEHVINQDLEKCDDVAVLTVTFGEKEEVFDLEVTLPAIKESASIARAKVEEYVTSCGMNNEEGSAITFATAEAIINACEHAYKNTLPGEFQVRGKCEDNLLTIEVADNGNWTRAAEVPESGPDPFCERGRGIPLMRAFSDSLRFFSKVTGGTVIILEKKLLFHNNGSSSCDDVVVVTAA